MSYFVVIVINQLIQGFSWPRTHCLILFAKHRRNGSLQVKIHFGQSLQYPFFEMISTKKKTFPKNDGTSFWKYPFSNLQEIFGQEKSPEENSTQKFQENPPMPPLRYPHLPAANDAPPVVPGPRSVDGRIKHGRKTSVAHKSIYKSINGGVGEEFFIISRMAASFRVLFFRAYV